MAARLWVQLLTFQDKPRHACKVWRTFRSCWHHNFLRSLSKSTNEDDPGRARFLRAVEPYHHTPYEEQLQLKQANVLAAMVKLANVTRYNKGRPTDAMVKRITDLGGYACLPDAIRPSPVIYGYRNKDRYSVGPGMDGQENSVGFFLFDRVEKCLKVQNGAMKCHRTVHYELSKAYEKFLQSHSLGVVNRQMTAGHWREFLVRSNEKGDILVSVCFHPQDLTQAGIDAAKEEVYMHFIQEVGKTIGIQSLYFQPCTRIRTSNEDGPFQLLHGQPHLHETISGYHFRVSPDSFLQLNTSAAEVLYETIREYGELTPDTTLLDVCCGTGTIGLVLSRHVKRVLGVEQISQAIQDAEHNACRNDVSNVKYYLGYAEKQIRFMVADLEPNEKVVAVVNPGRGGLGAKVMRAIRRCSAIRRVVYVSCKPHGRSCYNFVELMQREAEKFPGEPFVPTRAVAVDMFPHTKHYDLVLVMDR